MTELLIQHLPSIVSSLLGAFSVYLFIRLELKEHSIKIGYLERESEDQKKMISDIHNKVTESVDELKQSINENTNAVGKLETALKIIIENNRKK